MSSGECPKSRKPTNSAKVESAPQPKAPETPPSAEEMPTTRFQTWVDTLSKIAQIVAVVVGGIWAWSIFQRTTAPGLESKLSVQSRLTWNDTSDRNVCEAVLHVSAKNDGQRAFDIDSGNPQVALEARTADLGTLPRPGRTGNPVPIESALRGKWVQLRVDEPIVFKRDLAGHYPPGFLNESEATFLFARLPHRRIEFYLSLSGQESKSLLPFAPQEKVENYAWASDQLCGQTARDTEDIGGAPPR
jgi:hypothetical protein